MLVVDWIFLGIILGGLVLGALFGFGGIFKFFTTGIFGVIISVAVCLDDLRVKECIVPVLCEGTGTVRCQHGILNVPVPAVLNIVQEHQLELSITDIRGEMVTPTGAAIVAAVRTSDKLPGRFRVVRTGMGGGKREYERPGIRRAMLIERLRRQSMPVKQM